jgi:hypothetical protein
VGIESSLASAIVSTQPRKDAAAVKALLLKLCVAAGLCLFLLLVGEIDSYFVLQHRGSQKDRSKPPAFVAATTANAQQLWREWQFTFSHLQYKAFVIWRRDAFDGQTVHVDAAGLRRTEYSACVPGAYTIWMFGNSTLWGMGSTDSETLPSLLAKRFSEAGKQVCVRNYGEYGWVSTQELIALMLELKASPQKPDLVIFYDGVTDSFLPYETDAGDVHGNYRQMRAFFKSFREAEKSGFEFLRSSNTYRLLSTVREKFAADAGNSAKAVPARDAWSMAKGIRENYEKNMELAETLGQNFHFRCAFFWQPSAIVGPKPFTAEEEKLRTNEEAANRGIQEIFRITWADMRNEKNQNFVFLGDIFENHPGRLYIDASHVTPEGNQMLADRFFSVVQRKEGIKQAPSPGR